MEQFAALVFFAFAAITVASLVGWTRVGRQWWRGEPLLLVDSRDEPRWGLLDLLVAALLFAVAGPLIAGAALSGVFDIDMAKKLEEQPPGHRIGILGAGSIISAATFAISAGVMLWRTRSSFTELGIGMSRLRDDAILGFKAFVLIAPPTYALQASLVQLWPSEHPLIETLKEHPDPLFFVVAGVSAVIVAPIAEEYLFRLLLQGWLERLVGYNSEPTMRLLGGPPSRDTVIPVPPDADEAEGETPLSDTYLSPVAGHAEYEPLAISTKPWLPFWPILLSSVFFALAHWSHGPDPIPLFFLALGLGYLYQRTHRLTPCIVLHMLLNATSLIVLWIAMYGDLPVE